MYRSLTNLNDFFLSLLLYRSLSFSAVVSTRSPSKKLSILVSSKKSLPFRVPSSCVQFVFYVVVVSLFFCSFLHHHRHQHHFFFFFSLFHIHYEISRKRDREREREMLCFFASTYMCTASCLWNQASIPLVALAAFPRGAHASNFMHAVHVYRYGLCECVCVIFYAKYSIEKSPSVHRLYVKIQF